MTLRAPIRTVLVLLMVASWLLVPAESGALPPLTTCVLSGTYVLTAALSFEGTGAQFSG